MNLGLLSQFEVFLQPTQAAPVTQMMEYMCLVLLCGLLVEARSSIHIFTHFSTLDDSLKVISLWMN